MDDHAAGQGGEWLSVTEAAARLSASGDPVDRSTLSRYLSQHAEALPTRVEGKSRLVELGALAAHRSENIRIRSMPPELRPGRGQTVQPRRFAGSQSDGAARKAQADAEMREMDLAERRGELTPTAEVDEAGRDAIALMQSAFDRAVETEAAAVSVRYGWDERTARLAFKSFARRGIEVFNREIANRLDQARRRAEAGEPAASGPQALQ